MSVDVLIMVYVTMALPASVDMLIIVCVTVAFGGLCQ